MMPRWNPPADMAKPLADGDGNWENERWSPIVVTAMSGTEHNGRPVPIAWQIELDPCDEACEVANASLLKMGIEPDGYGWGEFIRMTIAEIDPPLAERLHIADCEKDTCVIWVESEDDCRALLEATWKLIVVGEN